MNNKIETNSLTFFIACGKKSWRKSEREMKRVQGKAHVVRVRAKRGIEGVRQEELSTDQQVIPLSRRTERVYSSPAI